MTTEYGVPTLKGPSDGGYVRKSEGSPQQNSRLSHPISEAHEITYFLARQLLPRGMLTS